MIRALIGVFLATFLTACMSSKPITLTEVKYITKEPPAHLLEACAYPNIDIITYRDALISLVEHQKALESCNVQIETLKKTLM